MKTIREAIDCVDLKSEIVGFSLTIEGQNEDKLRALVELVTNRLIVKLHSFFHQRASDYVVKQTLSYHPVTLSEYLDSIFKGDGTL